MAKVLVGFGALVDVPNQKGFTPLYIAAQNGHVEFVKVLAKLGADVNVRVAAGATPLFIAAQGGHVDVVKELIRLGVDVNSVPSIMTGIIRQPKDRNNTAWFLPAWEWKETSAINTEEVGMAPLHIATFSGHLETVRELLSAGAQVNVTVTTSGGDLEYINKVVVGKAPPERPTGLKKKSDEETGYRAWETILSGATPLYVAAQRGFVDIVQELLTRGANVNCVCGDTTAPLHVAAQNGFKEVVKVLLEHKADTWMETYKRFTPLHLAALGGHVEIAQALVEAGASVKATTIEEVTPLHLAAHGGNPEMVKLLVKHGAEIEAQTIAGYSPLLTACRYKKHDAVKALLELGANKNAKTKNGASPLKLAEEDKHTLQVLQHFSVTDASSSDCIVQ